MIKYVSGITILVYILRRLGTHIPIQLLLLDHEKYGILHLEKCFRIIDNFESI